MTLKHGVRAVDELFYEIQCLIIRYELAWWRLEGGPGFWGLDRHGVDPHDVYLLGARPSDRPPLCRHRSVDDAITDRAFWIVPDRAFHSLFASGNLQ